MGKSIKKSIKYLIIFLGIVIMFPTMLYLILQIPAVQTSIVKRITGHLSRELQSSISVGRVEYKFFNRLVISNVLFKDINNDTLLFTEKLTAGIRQIDIRNRSFGLGSVSLSEPVFAIITDTAGRSNLSWYLKQLQTTADSSKGSFRLTIDKVNLSDASFRFVNFAAEEKNGDAKVDFARLYLSEVNGIVEDFSIHDDTTSFIVHDLSFTEKSGFDVSKMNSNISLSGSNILFESLNIRTDSSILNFDRIGIRADTSTAFRNFADEVRLDVRVEKSLVSSADLAYFLKLPKGLNESLNLSGKFSGTISELRGRDVNITYGNGTMVDCDFDLSGLPDIDNTFIYIGVHDLKATVKDLEKLNIPGRKKFVAPEILNRLGDLSFNGTFTGFTTDFVTYGEFRTSKGSISTDISLRPEKSDRYRIRGLISGNNINLGELSESDRLGNLSIKANVDGYASSLKEFAGSLTGKIDSIEINDYSYRNIALSGKFTEKTWDGSINVVDQNISLDLLGMFNFNDTLPEFDFTLNLAKADLYRLKFDKADSTSALSMIMTSNFRGTNIDNLDGEIKLLSSSITKHGKTIELYDFSLRTFAEYNVPTLSLRTDFVNADIRGNYNFAGLKHLVNTTLSSLMPSLFTAETKSKETGRNNFTFDINFRNTDRINDFFKTGLLLAEKSYIKGSVLPETKIKIEGLAPSASIKNMVFDNLSFLINTSDSVLNTDITVSSLTLPGNTKLGNFSVGVVTEPDKFTVTTDWDNNEEVRNEGNLVFRGSIAENNYGMPVLRIDIDSTSVYTGNNRWKISQSAVVADSNAILIKNIHIGSDGRFYHIDGAISENTADTLYLQFRGIDISPLNYLMKKSGKDTAMIQMNLRGQLNGSVALTNIYENLLLESDIVVSDFSMLGSDYGDISVRSAFDYTRRVVDINAGNDLAGTRMFDVNGYYDPSNKSVFIDILASRLPVDALNPLLKSFASEISGFVTGKLKLSGRTDNLVLKGSVLAEKTTLNIDYLQTKYTITDSIRFDKKGFIFNNVKFSDAEGKQSTISGTIYHKNFRDYTADLTINMGNDFLVLNTQLRDNPSFYGKVYASGVTKIKTAPDLLSFDISARTGRNSKFFIPLTDELSVSEYSFISFIDSTGTTDSKEIKAPPPAAKQLGLNLNLDLTVTSDAVAQIIFDETVGDMITGSGSGILNINLDPKGNMEITGDYTIEQGNYLFTLGNILNKQFAIENGGRIMFNGDLEDAEIELKAIYNGNLRASLFPVLQEQRFSERRYSVEPQLLLSGKLFNPTVDFEIDLPNADEEAKAYLKNAISSEEELSRQFMYLLVIGEFYSEQSSTPSGYSSPSGTTTMAATTFEMLSNQLSNWISQISNDFDLGFTYRPGSGNKELDPDEVQIAFETQVLDDRVIINGNFDYRTTSGSTDQLTGDFEAELKLTEKLRFKVFNRFNDTYSGRGPYTQGVGIFFREDFEKLSDLFRKRTRQSMKKEDEITLKDE